MLKFRMLALQAMHGLSLDQTEYLVADRLSWMRFCGQKGAVGLVIRTISRARAEAVVTLSNMAYNMKL